MEEKVSGGKLARISIRNHTVVLSGDFFINPEDGVSLIEDALSRLNGDEPLEAVEFAVSKVVRERGLELIGLDERVIARLYKGAADVESNRA